MSKAAMEAAKQLVTAGYGDKRREQVRYMAEVIDSHFAGLVEAAEGIMAVIDRGVESTSHDSIVYSCAEFLRGRLRAELERVK